MRTPLLRLLPLFRPHALLVAVGVVGSFVGAACRVAAPAIVARAIDVALPQHDRGALLEATLAFLGLLVVDFGASFASRTALEVATQRALLTLKETLFLHLASQDVAFHDRTPAGSLIGRVQGDAEALRVLFVEVLFVLPSDLLMLLGMVAVLVSRSPGVAWPVLAVLPIYASWFWVFRTIAPRYFTEQRRSTAVLTGILAETVRVTPFLRILGREQWAAERAERQVAATRRSDVLGHFQPIWYFNGALAIRALAIVALLLVGASQVAHGTASIGLVVMGLSYLRQIFNPLMRLSNQLGLLERARAAAVRIAELLDEQPTVVDAPSAVPWPGLRRELRFEGVRFGYRVDQVVLPGLDLVLPAGTRLGIVGPTGSGKSTFVDLVLRFRDPDAGRITVDGVPLREIRMDDLRRRTALVLQDVRLLRGTVLDNLGGDRVSAQRALDEVGVTLPLDAQVEDGVLSRGERQLLTLARALVADPELLVLDEATSAVDPATEQRLERALDRLLVGRTVIVVAHRLETVRRCHTIAVLEHGEVVESGSHDALLRKGGRYAAFVARQAAA